jgi:chromosome segregation protein
MDSAPSAGRFFSRTGEWFDATGLRHGGSPVSGTSAASSRLGRRELYGALTADAETVSRELDTLTTAIDLIRAEISAIQISSFETAVNEARSSVGSADKAASQLDYQVTATERRRAQLDERNQGSVGKRDEATQEITQHEKQLAGIETSIKDVHDARLETEKELVRLEEASRIAFSAFNEVNIVAVQTQNELDRLNTESRRIEEDLSRIETDSVRRKQQTSDLEAARIQTVDNSESLEIELTRLRKDRNVLDEASTLAKDLLAEIKVAVSDVEARLREIRRTREDVMSGESKQNIRQAEIDTRLSDLIQTMAEDYEIDITTFSMEIDEAIHADTARIEIRELRAKIRTMGPVNALALDSFEEEKERLDFLRKQLEDLEAAETTLLETINEINETASARFHETFSAIQSHFVKLFVELFGEEASADVVLLDPSNPLESYSDCSSVCHLSR